jgi:hypothetical protein
MCHDTYFHTEILGKNFTKNDLIQNLKYFGVDKDSILQSKISTNKDNLKYFMDRGLSQDDA